VSPQIAKKMEIMLQNPKWGLFSVKSGWGGLHDFYVVNLNNT